MHHATDSGLFRTHLAGRNASMHAAFCALRQRDDVLFTAGASPQQSLFGGRVPVGVSANPCPKHAMISPNRDSGFWEMLNIHNEIFAVLTHCAYAHPRSELVLPEDFVELHFMLKGPVRVEFTNTRQIHINAPRLTVLHQGKHLRYRVTCDAGVWKSVALYVNRLSMQRWLKAWFGTNNALSHDLDAVQAEHLLCLQMAVDRQTLCAVEQLLENPFTDARRLLYAQAKITEILCHCIDLWLRMAHGDSANHGFSTRDLRLMEQAHDLLLADPTHVPTIADLAHAVGTNTSKLKRGFKFLYGTSIFACGHHHRMHHALHLLIDERLPVREVAARVGYQHQTSFTASFRGFFGFTPREALRMASHEPGFINGSPVSPGNPGDQSPARAMRRRSCSCK